MLFRPLDHFKIINFISYYFCAFSGYELNNFLLIIFSFLFLLFSHNIGILYTRRLFYNFFYLFIYCFFFIVVNLIKTNVGLLFLRFAYILFYIFFVLSFFNYVGIIPFSFTVTSHIIVTFYFAFGMFFGININLVKYYRIKALTLFLPNGTPGVIIPFLIIIEIISYFARVFSLSIRLFANMMAGHTLLTILAIFFVQMLASFSFIFFFSLLPAIIIFLVLILETTIAFLQAYVFLMLLCIYLNDTINMH